jgi:murein DD-endopeptidase MepM/ murein hydrolase activator NlpD
MRSCPKPFSWAIPKTGYLMSAAAAVLLSACSASVDRFSENPSDADPVYTASVPKKVVQQPSYDSGDDAISSRPLASAAPRPSYASNGYNYQSNYRQPAYKQPSYQQPAYRQPQEQYADAGSQPRSSGSGATVRVGNGMTLYSIAKANGMTVAQLAAANDIPPPYAVRVGQMLRIPGAAQAKAPRATFGSGAAAEPAAIASRQVTSGGSHRVAPGETLFSLGRAYRVSPYAIADLNNLSRSATLKVGQTVQIPGGGARSSQPIADAQPIANDSEDTIAADVPPISRKKDAARLTESDAAAGDDAVESSVPEPSQQAEAAPVPGRPALRWPVRGKVISAFGAKPNGMKNEGINIAVPEGTSIRAAESGVVAYAGNELKGYGNLVLIRHEGGWVTAYAHAKELFVKRGDTVKRGDVIAKAGQTGSVSSPQLHFEVRKGATAMDPSGFLSSSTASN